MPVLECVPEPETVPDPESVSPSMPKLVSVPITVPAPVPESEPANAQPVLESDHLANFPELAFISDSGPEKPVCPACGSPAQSLQVFCTPIAWT